MSALDALSDVDPARAQQEIMCRKLIDKAVWFYKDPKNRRAYEDWIKQKEARNNAASHSNP